MFYPYIFSEGKPPRVVLELTACASFTTKFIVLISHLLVKQIIGLLSNLSQSPLPSVQRPKYAIETTSNSRTTLEDQQMILG